MGRLAKLGFLARELYRAAVDPRHIPFQEPGTERYFARCATCGRVFRHYWACVTAEDRQKGRQIGCPCGSTKFRACNLFMLQEAGFVVLCYLWRNVVKKERFWDPRIAVRMKDHPQHRGNHG